MIPSSDPTVCLTPVSIGELIDKITILSLKREYIQDPAKLANIENELVALEAALPASAQAAQGVEELTSRLLEVNRSLWHIEDDIRDCERRKDFGPRFIELARSVYFTNDKRAELKRQINAVTGSALVEEKSYQAY
jgi:hypothetical protein